MSDFLTQLERDLVKAAARQAAARATVEAEPRTAWWSASPRTLLITAALTVFMAASGAAATLTVLRGSPLPGPSEEVAGKHASPVPGSSKLEPMRARDPGGGPPWAIRVARSKAGLVCTTVGQVVDGDFGIVGLDGRFRTLSDAAVDGCGDARRNATSLIGARVFDAPRRRDVRTIVNGLAGAELRSVAVESGRSRRTVPLGPNGTFVVALRGYPDDIGIRVVLRFADEHTESHVLGVRSRTPDPLGAGSWEAASGRFPIIPPRGGEARPGPPCVSFVRAESRLGEPRSPPACGIWPKGTDRPTGYFFAVRRLDPSSDSRYSLPNWRWTGPPRTAIWGAAGRDVRRIVVRGPNLTRTVPLDQRGSNGERTPESLLVALFPPTVNPDELRVEVTLKDGSVHVERGDTNLVPPLKEP